MTNVLNNILGSEKRYAKKYESRAKKFKDDDDKINIPRPNFQNTSIKSLDKFTKTTHTRVKLDEDQHPLMHKILGFESDRKYKGN